MDARFQPALAALKAGDVRALEALLAHDPGLAAARSQHSHPTLMQALVLEGAGLLTPTLIALAQRLFAAGAPVDEPLVATGSNGNTVMAIWLLDQGARLEGRPDLLRGWTVLEEALYWGFPDLVGLLLERGAAVPNLRVAAGLGRQDAVEACFTPEGELDPERAGLINWPFARTPPGHPDAPPQALLDHALAYAAIGGHASLVRWLAQHGADVHAHPLGFHVEGTPLHHVAIRGMEAMCMTLVELGADPDATDLTYGGTPAHWALQGGHKALARLLGTPDGA